MAECPGDPFQEANFHGSSVDLADGFYQNSNPKTASWFGIHYPETAGYYNCTRIWDEDLEDYRPIDETERVYPVLTGLAMEWKRAFYFCQ
eukprot:8829166-Heterocapsa_arctica.AAC.1